MSDTEPTTETAPVITHADALLLKGILEEAANEAQYNPASMLSAPRMWQGHEIAAAVAARTEGQP
ncbi:hypothetical protein SEA_OTTAWA_21 [Arthrobacter phage Ottawa]|nr:hypothetical protein SEA_KHARCHO_21 [Arthrobacter phage Kharcho]WIC89253.1 hypothetical protein SEA_OTTAWA_21 [Arthrobacter phage Ottawa]